MNEEIRQILTEVFTPENARIGLEKVAEPLGATTSGLAYSQGAEVLRDFGEWFVGELENHGYTIVRLDEAKTAAV